MAATDGKLYPTDGGGPRPIPGIEPADLVERWAAEPGSLLVRRKLESGDQQVFRLDATGRRTLVHQIARVPGSVMGRWFTITPDGSAYAMTYSIGQSDLFRVTGLK